MFMVAGESTNALFHIFDENSRKMAIHCLNPSIQCIYASFYFLCIFSSPVDREYVEMIFFIFISMGSHDLKLFIVITLESFHIVSRIFKQTKAVASPYSIQWREMEREG